MRKDIFEEYLNDKEDKNYKEALTASSYKNVYEHKLGGTNFKDNSELSTYGDAILKLAFCEHFRKEENEIKGKNLTLSKAKYESDAYLVFIVAKKYDLLQYMNYNKEQQAGYNYNEDKNNEVKNYLNYLEKITEKKNVENIEKPAIVENCKYIATTVEAVIAAIYIEKNKDINAIVDLVKIWISLDKEEN